MLTALQEANIRAEWGRIVDDGLVVEPGSAQELKSAISPQWQLANDAFSGDRVIPDEINDLRNNFGWLSRNLIFSTLHSLGATLDTNKLAALIYAWGVGSRVGRPDVDDRQIGNAVNRAVWSEIAPIISSIQNSDVLSVSDYQALITSPSFGGATGINIGYASKFFYFLELTMNLGASNSPQTVKCQIYDSQVRAALENRFVLAGSIFGPTMWWESDSSLRSGGRWRVPEIPNYWDYFRYCQALDVMADVTSKKLGLPVDADDIEARLFELGNSY